MPLDSATFTAGNYQTMEKYVCSRQLVVFKQAILEQDSRIDITYDTSC